jgi:hypothetical protein
MGKSEVNLKTILKPSKLEFCTEREYSANKQMTKGAGVLSRPHRASKLVEAWFCMCDRYERWLNLVYTSRLPDQLRDRNGAAKSCEWSCRCI